MSICSLCAFVELLSLKTKHEMEHVCPERVISIPTRACLPFHFSCHIRTAESNFTRDFFLMRHLPS